MRNLRDNVLMALPPSTFMSNNNDYVDGDVNNIKKSRIRKDCLFVRTGDVDVVLIKIAIRLDF